MRASGDRKYVGTVCFDGSIHIYNADWTELCAHTLDTSDGAALPGSGHALYPPAKQLFWAPLPVGGSGASDSSTYYLATAGVSEPGPIRLYRFSRSQSGVYSVVAMPAVIGSFTNCWFTHLNGLIALSTTGGGGPKQSNAGRNRNRLANTKTDASTDSKKSANGKDAAPSVKETTTLALYAIDGKQLKSVTFDGLATPNGHAFNPYPGCEHEIAVSFRDRTIRVVDSSSFSVLYPVINTCAVVAATGQLHSLLWWDRDHLLVPSDNGQYRIINKTKGGESLAAVFYGPPRMTWMEWAVPRERLSLALMGELRSLSLIGKLKPPPAPKAGGTGTTQPTPSSAALFAQIEAATNARTERNDGAANKPAADTKTAAPTVVVTSPSPAAAAAAADVKDSNSIAADDKWLERSSSFELSYSALGCSNVSLNGDGTMAAVGDLGGNVIVWRMGQHSPVYTTQYVPVPVPVLVS